jgi:hypothetical protein
MITNLMQRLEMEIDDCQNYVHTCWPRMHTIRNAPTYRITKIIIYLIVIVCQKPNFETPVHDKPG